MAALPHDQYSPFERFTGRLDNVKRSGAGVTARCPSHDDRQNSLSITELSTGRLLVRCHAGCETERLVAAVGLTMADLFPPNASTVRQNGHGRHLIATYDYHDAEGSMIYQAVRYGDPKDFRSRRPDGTGGWIWNLDDTERALYRLPELIAADPAEWVHVVEGEKDADALAALGLVVTCNLGGAGKWRPEYTEALRSRHVVILPDNDSPGQQHAETVAHALSGIAANVRVLLLPELPKKGDVSDWLDAGGDKARLKALIETAPAWEPSTDGVEPTNDTGDGQPNDSEPARRRPSQATALVAMAAASDTEFFTDGGGEPFATFTVNGHRETAALSTKGFKRWLGQRYYDRHGNAPGAQAVQDALNVLERVMDLP